MAKILGKFILLFMLNAPLASFARSPMPAEPSVRGVRYVFWHTLRDLNDSLSSWMDPNNVAQFTYREFPNEAVDRSVEIKAAEKLYEAVREDYLSLVSTGEIDYVDLKTSDYGLRLEAANLIYGHSLSVHFEFAQVLRSFKLKRDDSRYIFVFFFDKFVDPNHRPLESLSTLSQSSTRAKALIDRLLNGVRSRMLAAQIQMKEISELVTTAGEIDRSKATKLMKDFKSSSDDLDYRLTWLKRKLKASSHVANDQLRVNNTVAILEERMAKLGTGLHNLLGGYQHHQKTGQVSAGHLGMVNDGILLSHAREDLIDIFGIQGHIGGVSMYEADRGANNEKAYSVLADTAIMQFLFTAGAMMSALSETVEVRGDWRERATQELNFRSAQISSRLNLQSSSTSLTVGSQAQATAERRNFLTGEQSKRRSDYEDHLWRIFFEHAKLSAFGNQAWGESLCSEQVIVAPDIKLLK